MPISSAWAIFLSFLACLPLIEADLPAALALDQRCLGGLWTRSGYERELNSDCSDLLVLARAPSAERLKACLADGRSRPALEDPTACEPTACDLTACDSTAYEPTAYEPIAYEPTAYEPTALHLLGTGCLWAILEEAHITTLAIEPAFQGQKLGQLLLTELLLCAHRRGLTRATLEVRTTNQPALKLYQKFEFKAAGIRKRYYSDGEDAHILWRSGLQNEATLAQIYRYKKEAIAQIASTAQLMFVDCPCDATQPLVNLD